MEKIIPEGWGFVEEIRKFEKWGLFWQNFRAAHEFLPHSFLHATCLIVLYRSLSNYECWELGNQLRTFILEIGVNFMSSHFDVIRIISKTRDIMNLWLEFSAVHVANHALNGGYHDVISGSKTFEVRRRKWSCSLSCTNVKLPRASSNVLKR